MQHHNYLQQHDLNVHDEFFKMEASWQSDCLWKGHAGIKKKVGVAWQRGRGISKEGVVNK